MPEAINNQYAIEQALDRGDVWARMSHGRFWRVRRNGATKTWKTRPGEFRIPVKMGLRTCGELTHRSEIDMAPDGRGDWLVTGLDPNTRGL